MSKLLKVSHNREEDFKRTCDKLKDLIDAFAEETCLNEFYNYFKKRYSLPKNVVKQALKGNISGRYDYRKCSFNTELFPKNCIKYAAKYLSILVYLLGFSKKYKNNISYYKLILNCDYERDIERLSKLINLIGKNNILIVTENNIDFKGYKTVSHPRYKYCDRNETRKAFYKELKYGLPLYIKLSRKLKVNLIPIVIRIICQYLLFYTVFTNYRSKLYVEQRTYATSPVRNYLFRKNKGKYLCCTQINIIPLGPNGFYYDTDVFFAFGNKTAERAFEYGGRINHVVPVGSTAMERYYYSNKYISRKRDCKYDVVFIGINAIFGFHYLDAYSTFMKDYYDSFRWLAKFSKNNSHLKIGIKHHFNNKKDEKEMEIIKDTPVERIDQTLNTYEIVNQSKCAVTFGSTMGYELIGNGTNVLYLDPGGRCVFLPEKDGSILGPYQVTNYNEFSERLHLLLNDKQIVGNDKFDRMNVCLPSENVSERIYSWITSNVGN